MFQDDDCLSRASQLRVLKNYASGVKAIGTYLVDSAKRLRMDEERENVKQRREDFFVMGLLD